MNICVRHVCLARPASGYTPPVQSLALPSEYFSLFPFAQELVATTTVGFGLQRGVIDFPFLL